jgi:AcrR family transcriptional regulator
MGAGRPRSFDIDKALQSALDVFLSKGYDGASLADLTQAMGINPPSLYAAFGNKEGLFREALRRYEGERDDLIARALNAPTAAEFVERYLRGGVEGQTPDDRSHGCLFVQGSVACGDQGLELRKALSVAQSSGHAALTARLHDAQAAGEISQDVEIASLVRFVDMAVKGLAVQAAGGAQREELLATVEMTMKAWPGMTKAKAPRRAKAAGR